MPKSCSPLGVEDSSHAEVDGSENPLTRTLLGGVGRQLHREEARVAHLHTTSMSKTLNYRVYKKKSSRGAKKCSQMYFVQILRNSPYKAHSSLPVQSQVPYWWKGEGLPEGCPRSCCAEAASCSPSRRPSEAGEIAPKRTARNRSDPLGSWTRSPSTKNV